MSKGERHVEAPVDAESCADGRPWALNVDGLLTSAEAVIIVRSAAVQNGVAVCEGGNAAEGSPNLLARRTGDAGE